MIDDDVRVSRAQMGLIFDQRFNLTVFCHHFVAYGMSIDSQGLGVAGDFMSTRIIGDVDYVVVCEFPTGLSAIAHGGSFDSVFHRRL